MGDELLERALQDPSLSHRAVGVLLRIVRSGRVPSADQLSALGKEGRDAMRAALKELIDGGYVSSTRERKVDGWSTSRAVINERGFPAPTRGFSVPDAAVVHGLQSGGISAPKSGFPAPDRGFSGVNNYKYMMGTSSPNGEEVPMGAAGPRPLRSPEVESFKEIFGSAEVPDGPDTKGLEKYEAMRVKRQAKDVSRWTAHDLAEEFAYRVREAYPDPSKHFGQLGTPTMKKLIGRWIREGRKTPAELHAIIGLFFRDPRNLNKPGIGLPIYQRFISFIPTVQGEARVLAGLDADTSMTLTDVEAEVQNTLRRLSE